MGLIVESERWCEVVVGRGRGGSQPLCGDVALTVCGTCGMGLCELHEVICRECHESYCSHCDHVCAVVSQAA